MKRIFFCLLLVLTNNAHSETETIENTLLKVLVSNNTVSYENVEVNNRVIAQAKQCNSKKIKASINKRRLDIAHFEMMCADGKIISFPAKLDGKAKSLVAKTTIKRKTRLNKNNTSIEWLPLSKIKGIPTTDYLPEGEFLTTRNLKKQQQINIKFVEVAPMIERGWTIKAQSLISNIAIYVDVLALESGAKGETIKVKNVSSGSTFYAKIINSTTVTIK